MGKMIQPQIGLALDQAIMFLVGEYAQSGYNSKPVITHSIMVAFYLLNYDYDLSIIEAAILHDLLEDSRVKSAQIEKRFGREVAKIVSALTFKVAIKEKEKQYKELFARTQKAGKKALIVKCADIYINSLYIKFVKDKEKEIFLLAKVKYFLDLAQPKIGQERVWQDLFRRFNELKAILSPRLKNVRIKSVNDLNPPQVNQLVRILNTDEKLIQSLGGHGEKITAEEFKAKNIAWAKNNKAKLFAIMFKSRAIGMISLSHINLKAKKANIGYWLASKHWGKGITTEAFKQILVIAKNDKIKYLSCTIHKDNKSSLAIWQAFQAKITQKGGDFIPVIKL
ncbi:MAG: GNAT family N-acetyltransferase [Candidatus Parcubacteria bacterium]|nr:GNAT family N-acetyltransferase [Candidatus Parcubacteria bacterium]